MARFTRALREQIVREFTTRHNGQFDPSLFLAEVEEAGATHPAYEWFEWDESIAARRFQVEQARAFARDIKVVFSVEEVGRDKSITIKEYEAPLAFSPLDGRHAGGGYALTDMKNKAHIVELCAQGAADLEAWLRRYRGVLVQAGGSAASIERQVGMLRAVSAAQADAA